MKEPGDEARLRHMLDAAREAIDFADGRTRQDMEIDRMLSYALIHAVEIVGEAAARITGETQDRYPEVPWMNVIGMRHRLAHGYYNVSLDIVWDVVQLNLPDLVIALEKIVDQ